MNNELLYWNIYELLNVYQYQRTMVQDFIDKLIDLENLLLK